MSTVATRSLVACGVLMPFLMVSAVVGRGPDGVASAQPNDNRAPAGRLENGTLTVNLVATRAMWYPDGDSLRGRPVATFGEEGKAPQIPGPLLRVPRGTAIRLTVRNALDGDTIAVHMAAPSEPVGDSTLIPPGATREIHVTAATPGTFMYRATTNQPLSRALEIHELMVGAFIVDSAGARTPADRVFVLTALADSVDADGIEIPERSVFAINGRSWPHTERISTTVGDSLHWRVVNASPAVHPMHLHGVYFRIDDFSGPAVRPAELAWQPRWVVTQRMSSFSTMSMTWAPERPGNWLFHCHFQVHMTPGPLRPVDHAAHDAMRGMGGLVLGITARPRGGEVSDAPGARRRLRLVAVRDSGFPDSAPSLRFVLDEHGPRADAGPGFSPPIVLQRGAPVSINIVNGFDEPTSVHWHGIELESYYDGVPGFGGSAQRLTPIIMPRDSFEVRFTPPRAGTFMYHSHVAEVRQHRAGLAGALIVRDGSEPAANADHVFFIKSARAGAQARPPLEINGRSNPDTVILRVGQTARLRIISLTVAAASALVSLTSRSDSVRAVLQDTAVVHWRLVAKDGADIPAAERLTRPARQLMAMGETYDFEVTPASRGHLRLEVRGAGRGGLLFARVPIRVE